MDFNYHYQSYVCCVDNFMLLSELPIILYRCNIMLSTEQTFTNVQCSCANHVLKPINPLPSILSFWLGAMLLNYMIVVENTSIHVGCSIVSFLELAIMLLHLSYTSLGVRQVRCCKFLC